MPGYQFHIASSREPAIREAAPHYEENMKMFGELRLLRAGGFFAGRPEDIIEQLKAVEKRHPGTRSSAAWCTSGV